MGNRKWEIGKWKLDIGNWKSEIGNRKLEISVGRVGKSWLAMCGRGFAWGIGMP
jgi:hypothetical protein